MVHGKKSTQRSPSAKAQASLPVWYHPESPLGSAVRYVASLSGRFNWVGIYVQKGKTLELVHSVGEASHQGRESGGVKSELAVVIRNKKGKVLGQLDIDNHMADAFSPKEEQVIRQVAQELGELWPK